MAKIVCEQNSGYACLLWVTPDMEDLAENLSDKFSLIVGLVPCGYYMSREEQHNCGGAIGYIGVPPQNRQNFQEKTLTLNIQCQCTKEIPVDKIVSLSEKLDVAEGGTYTMQPLKINTLMEHNLLYESSYYYKKPGFDEAYSALRKMIPDLTEDEFSNIDFYHHNTDDDDYDHTNMDLVEITSEYRGDYMLLRTDKRLTTKKGKINGYNITLSIIATDISKNKQQLLEILGLCQQYLK